MMIALLFKTTILFPADTLATYATYTLMVYLTSVWKLNLTYAVAIVNLFKGSIQLLPLVIQFIIDAYTGHFFMLLLTTISYSTGLCLLTMSTPPVTGPCSQYRPECIGEEQRRMFFAALALIAMGMSGFNVSARKFHDIQVEAEKAKPPPKLGFCYWSACITTYVIPPILVLAISYLKPWFLQFGIPAAFSVIATLLFASGTCEYNGKYQSAKASSLIEQKQRKWRPRMSRIVPTCLCFAVCGIVSAAGDTYFLQQAKTMNPMFWLSTIPINFLKTTRKGWQGKDGPKDKEKFGDLKGVGFARFLVAMGVSIICCTIAAIVEFCRLGVVKRNGLTDKPDEIVPMSILWILPQFVLLGYLDRNHKRGCSQLLGGIVSSPMKDEYLSHIVSAVSGVGTMGSALCTFAVDVISKRIGKKGWFQDTLNESRLDYYYWMLAFLSALNFGFFFFIDSIFKTWEPEREEIRNQEDKKVI